MRKSQSSIEVLIVYAWSILGVLVIFGLLNYYGILSPKEQLPESCDIIPGIMCVDSQVTAYHADLFLHNRLGRLITIENIDLVRPDGFKCSTLAPKSINDGERTAIEIPHCDNGEEGQFIKANLILTYTGEGFVKHIIEGKIVAKIQPGGTITSEEVCTNANNLGLCFGLDEIFGDYSEGYEEKCCEEHELCC
jgi:hypothetical protein